MLLNIIFNKLVGQYDIKNYRYKNYVRMNYELQSQKFYLKAEEKRKHVENGAKQRGSNGGGEREQPYEETERQTKS